MSFWIASARCFLGTDSIWCKSSRSKAPTSSCGSLAGLAMALSSLPGLAEDWASACERSFLRFMARSICPSTDFRLGVIGSPGLPGLDGGEDCSSMSPRLLRRAIPAKTRFRDSDSRWALTYLSGRRGDDRIWGQPGARQKHVRNIPPPLSYLTKPPFGYVVSSAALRPSFQRRRDSASFHRSLITFGPSFGTLWGSAASAGQANNTGGAPGWYCRAGWRPASASAAPCAGFLPVNPYTIPAVLHLPGIG